MKVLAAYPWPSFWSMGEGRGAPSFFLSITSFPKHGHEMHVVMPGTPGCAAEEDYHGAVLHRFPTTTDYMPDASAGKLIQHWRMRMSYRDWMATAVPALRDVAERVGPDVMFGMGALGAPAAHAVARELGVPNVTRLFGTSIGQVLGSPIRYRLRYREINAFRTPADAIILCDDGSGGDEIARMLGVEMDRLRFWPNGVDRELLRGPADIDGLRMRLEISRDTPVVLSVSRLDREKRVDRLLHATPELLRRVPGAIIVIAGDGPERHALDELSVKLGVFESVRFSGILEREQLAAAYQLASVFVTLSERTNILNPLHEAMTAGLPVVAFDAGRTASIVRTGETGVLVTRDALPALGITIADLLLDEGRREQLGRAAAEDAERRLPTIDERQRMEVEAVEAVVTRAGRSGRK